MAGDMKLPIGGGFVGRVAKLHLVWRRTFPERCHFEFVRCCREAKRLDEGFPAGKGRCRFHGVSFQAGWLSAGK